MKVGAQRKVINSIIDESVELLIVGSAESQVQTTKLKKNELMKLSKEETAKHHHNLEEILLCTNATLILRHGRIGYICSYCPQEFQEPAMLKEHTLANHTSDTPLPDGFNDGNLYEYLIKLDITGLCCLLCDINIDSLDELLDHLSDEHDKVIHTDINNHIIPFKFNNEQLTCCLCSNVFDKFKTLQEHMHKHYRNYICDECDSGYVTRGCLTRHKNTHRKGSFPCTFCPKVYDTRAAQYQHILNKHTHVALHKCGYCDESFSEHFTKERHLAEVHGVNNQRKCSICDITFSCEKYLKRHVKKLHLLEKRHECTECDMKFFSTSKLARHMVKHTGLKKYQCHECLKSYGCKSTLQKHMRIHNDDRRFKCEYCGQTFVQKCSWKGHMKSKHGEIVV